MKTLLHAAIDTGNVGLVRVLLEKGADVNKNMVFTHRGPPDTFYLMSCLQLAKEKGNAEIVKMLVEAQAEEVIKDGLPKLSRFFYRGWNGVKNYDDGGAGKWKEKTKKGKVKKLSKSRSRK